MTERVTVEQNGERFTLDVPDGTTDEQIQSFLTQQPKPNEPSAAPNIAAEAGQAAVGKLSPVNPYGTTVGEAGSALKSGAQAVGQKIGQTTLSGAGTLAADAYAALHGLPPIATVGKKVLQSVLPGSQTTIAEGINAAGQGLKGMAGGAMNVGKTLAQGAMAPENLLTLPYNMAAYEQAKIRANPTAPGLESNPYAQTVRGEYATQGQAGAANARNALINQQYGGLTPQEQAILKQDRQRQQAKAVLAQPPTAQNFIQRSKALSDLYGGVGQ